MFKCKCFESNTIWKFLLIKFPLSNILLSIWKLKHWSIHVHDFNLSSSWDSMCPKQIKTFHPLHYKRYKSSMSWTWWYIVHRRSTFLIIFVVWSPVFILKKWRRIHSSLLLLQYRMSQKNPKRRDIQKPLDIDTCFARFQDSSACLARLLTSHHGATTVLAIKSGPPQSVAVT